MAMDFAQSFAVMVAAYLRPLMVALRVDLHVLVDCRGAVCRGAHCAHFQGRTTHQFVLGVPMKPTLFSVIWFGSFGGISLFGAPYATGDLLTITNSNFETVTFALSECHR